MSFAALALPSLDGVSPRYTVQSGDTFVRPLALSLLDNGVIGECDAVRRPTSEIALCAKALSRHWREITANLTMFDWQLRIEQDQYGSSEGSYWRSYRPRDPDVLWALIGTLGGPFSCRQICVGPAIDHLEKLRRGFGQTVLAAVYDVLHMLPRVCTTSTAIGIAEYTYWHGYSNEQDAFKEALFYHDVKTKQELAEVSDFVTHEQMYGPMPNWARQPERVLSRAQLERAAKPDAFAKSIIDAVDELWTVLSFCAPFANHSSPDAEAELVDFTLILRWTEGDSLGRILDDYGHYAAEGDYIPAASVCGLRLSDRSISDWLKKMRASALLAAAVERVLGLLGSREFEEQRTLVRVFA